VREFQMLSAELFKGDRVILWALSLLAILCLWNIYRAPKLQTVGAHQYLNLSVDSKKAPLQPNLRLAGPEQVAIPAPVSQSTTGASAQPPQVISPPTQPHPISSVNDKVPAISRIQTSQPVVFLGIDDGWTKSPEAQDWLVQNKLPFSLFLENNAIKDNYDYFGLLQAAGMTIEDHTLTHPDMAKLSLEQQKAEICGTADTYEPVFGVRPVLFRPPYGSFNDDTRQAAAECGMKALILWHAKANGGSMQFQDGNASLQPGDIVLMHFRPEFLADMQAFIKQVQQANLQIGHLEDWL
jgi:peptidoglycan-N-acetylglucosamine deacetylase